MIVGGVKNAHQPSVQQAADVRESFVSTRPAVLADINKIAAGDRPQLGFLGRRRRRGQRGGSTGGLRRKGEARHSQARHLAQEIVVQPIGAQRRNRQRHLSFAQPADGGLHQRRHARIVGWRQRSQRGFVVPALADAFQQRVHHCHRIALAHRPIHHARLAEATPFCAAARDLHRHAIEHRLGKRQGRVIREGIAIDLGNPCAPHRRWRARIERLSHRKQAGGWVTRGAVQARHVERKAAREPG